VSDSRPRIAGIALGVFLAASVLTAIAALVVAVNRAPVLSPAPPPDAAAGMVIPADRPIPAEAEVFRTHAGVLAIGPGTLRQREAHPRTLVRFRFLRAYPGAPPRIPHGFTADEFRTGECNTCHERGGYSPRFSAYAPVTPHPGMPACLQCHVGSDAVTGVSLPSLDPSTICRQCHAPGAARWAEASVDWRPMAWPALSPRGGATGVPPIAHDLFFRGNCLACHAGPSGVAEIRTTHPERANCRQCHVAPQPAVEEYVRPAPALDTSSEGR
jgi:cytochrome c-type protein NapB